MIGLIVKDYYSLRKTFAMCLLFVLTFAAMLFVTKRYVLLPLPAVLIFTTMITGTFTKDHMVDWNKLAATTPVSRKGIVKSKYCLYCLILLFGTIFSLILGLIGMKLGTLKMASVVEMLLMSVAISIFAGSISLLLLYTWQGAVEKIELITVISYALSVGAVIAFLKLSDQLFSAKMYGFILCLVLSVIFLVVTYFISVKTFEKKELS